MQESNHNKWELIKRLGRCLNNRDLSLIQMCLLFRWQSNNWHFDQLLKSQAETFLVKIKKTSLD